MSKFTVYGPTRIGLQGLPGTCDGDLEGLLCHSTVNRKFKPDVFLSLQSPLLSHFTIHVGNDPFDRGVDYEEPPPEEKAVHRRSACAVDILKPFHP